MTVESRWYRPAQVATLVSMLMCAIVPLSADPVISAGLGLANGYVGSPIPFWIEIKADTEWQGVGLQMLGSTYRILQCSERRERDCLDLPTEVRAASSLIVASALTISDSGSHKPTVVLSFRNASSGMPQAVAVPLGEIEMVRREFAWIDWAKELAFPAALGFVAFVYGQSQRKAQQLAKRSADRLEMLRVMLPLTHKYNTRYYLNLHVAAARLYDTACASKLRTALPVAGQRTDELTYWLLKMTLEHRRMHLGPGAFYFSDRNGEELLVLAFEMFDSDFYRNDTGLELATSRLLDALQGIPVLTFARYQECLSDISIGAQAALIRTRLTTWLPTATDGLHAIGAFATILDFEINRMYEAWYPEPEQLEIADEPRKVVLNASSDRKRTKYATYFDAHCGKAQKKWWSFR